MISIKKRSLVVLIAVSLVAGAASMALYAGVDVYRLLQPGYRAERMISEEDYDWYRYLHNAYGKIDRLREHVSAHYYLPVEDEDLELGMLRGLFDGLDDPYSYYMTAEEYESVVISLTGEYSGIGVSLSTNKNGAIEVVAPQDGSPAHAAGVRRGDIILKVDGTSYSGTEIDLAAAAIRGKAGTRVTLTLLRDGEEVELSIRREKIISQTVRWEWMDGDIAHIRIASFEESTASDFKKALRTVEQRGAKGFVLDLRDNPGGLVNASVDVADALMDKGTVVYSEDQAGNREYFHVKDGKTDLPFVVLVNEGSASASEILTAGLQDNGVALIVGTTTFGKGIIQQLEQLRDGSAINLTVMQYYSPKGHVIHGVGIEPDINVEPEEEDYAQDGTLLVDRQLNRGWEIVNGQ